MDDELKRFLLDVSAEVGRAREKFPETEGCMVALVEEVGELARAILDESPERIRAEAVQVACMAVRVVLDGDASLDHYRAKRGLGSFKK